MSKITPDLIIKRGDRIPALKSVLEEYALNSETGKYEWRPIPDLASATSLQVFLASTDVTPAITVYGTVTVTNPATAAVEYAWADGDTNIAALYRVEVRITWPEGKLQTIPNQSYNWVLIEENLGT
jgi:hypothetical protein